MRVNIQETGHCLRLNNMKPGVLFESEGNLYIRTDASTDYLIKCVDVVSGKLRSLRKEDIVSVRDDLHITNRKDKDED